ncbi:nuclear transport factor 2 family protein [Actinomadura fibrosa]|uniref:Nuclear transport factor 2 family protein n=1 Tax=Actinomadura fibrosa TaxID=111802 RepID=A0ABW2XL23_9ACTN|nr:nuclear transport factor 2 family protein [Actinomadura fibrosa]
MESWELVARERVRDAVAAYTHAADRGRAGDLAALFAPDGVLEIRGGATAAGREAIAALVAGAAGRGSAPRPDGHPGVIRHFVANLRFEEVAPDAVRASAYFLVMNATGPDHWGRYRDLLVPGGDEGQWLFARRFVSVDGASETSVMVSGSE